jgi:Ferritin-like domain
MIGRRQLLREGGVVLSLGAVIAACGDDRGGSDDPGRVGNAPPPSSLPEGVVDDVVLLRTAQSLEYVVLEMLAEALDSGTLDADTTAVLERFVEDHTRHADHVGALIAEAGGEAYECPNRFITDRTISPIREALEDTDDLARDLLYVAHALETLAAQTYQDLVGRLTSPELRKEMMVNGAEENRHSAVLALSITGVPEGYVNPTITGGEAPGESEFPIPYAIPASFGQLGGIDLVIGAPNEEGVRTRITLQTPAENAFVYGEMSC